MIDQGTGAIVYTGAEFIQNTHIAWDREQDCGPGPERPMHEGK